MTEVSIAADVALRFGKRLVDWYLLAARDLPWRHRSDAYSIWVSEILLQQTTVNTVLERYEPFLRKFPNLGALAASQLEDVIAAVQGLGYYRRFRFMHRAAVQLVQSGRTDLPGTREELQALPGLGPYTAGAIASIAFGLKEPAVDGNVVRVVTRHFGLTGLCDDARTRRKLASSIPPMMPDGRASEFTQSLFDVGATLCKPTKPLCESCPVSATCTALASDSIEAIPAPQQRRKSLAHVVAVALVSKGDRVLLRQRPKTESRMPSFWELPECWAADESAARADLKACLEEALGTVDLSNQTLARIRHTITTNLLDCRLIEAAATQTDQRPAPHAMKWMTPAAIQGRTLPITTITRKLVSTWQRS